MKEDKEIDRYQETRQRIERFCGKHNIRDNRISSR